MVVSHMSVTAEGRKNAASPSEDFLFDEKRSRRDSRGAGPASARASRSRCLLCRSSSSEEQQADRTNPNPAPTRARGAATARLSSRGGGKEARGLHGEPSAFRFLVGDGSGRQFSAPGGG